MTRVPLIMVSDRNKILYGSKYTINHDLHEAIMVITFSPGSKIQITSFTSIRL